MPNFENGLEEKETLTFVKTKAEELAETGYNDAREISGCKELTFPQAAKILREAA
ncbi:MAG: hypothetical protein WCX88_04340 [Patescibacteria group bacterium]